MLVMPQGYVSAASLWAAARLWTGALRDAGLLSIIGDECYLAPEAGDLKAAQFPDNLEAVITTRIDRLSPQLQLVVKVASVLGRVFTLSLLRAVHPIEADRAGLPEHLAALERREIGRAHV